jgi:hypothetical protein
MAIVVPIVTANASLASPLITPGWPMVSVEQSSPVADVVMKTEPPVIQKGTVESITHEKARAQSGHANDHSQ